MADDDRHRVGPTHQDRRLRVAILPDPVEPVGERRVCEIDGCKLKTTFRKPFCSKHVPLMPYVANVLREIAEGAK